MLMKTKITFFLAFLAVCCFPAMAQFQVKGTVLSNGDDEPLIGATVMENGTRNDTVSLSVSDAGH